MQFSKLTNVLTASALALGLAAAAAPAQASVLILFTSFSSGNSNAANIRFVNKGASDPDSALIYTTATATSTSAGAAKVRISFFEDPAIPDFLDLPALFTLNGSVTDTPALFDGTTYTQTGVNGAFQFVYAGPTTVLDGKSLVHNSSVLFSGTFSNAWISGRGGVGGMDLTIANGGFATYASNYYDLSNFDPSTDEFSFHFGATSPTFARANASSALRTFRAHTGGDFQAALIPVPEPATWALMIGGFGLAGAALRRRRSLVAA